MNKKTVNCESGVLSAKEAKTFYRDHDVVFGNKDLVTLATFENFPIKSGVSKSHETDIKRDISICISSGSGMLQINPLIDISLLYSTGHGAGTVGQTWESHHQLFSEFIEKSLGSKVLEIGSGNGVLARLLHNRNALPEEWVAMDPDGQVDQEKFPKNVKFERVIFDSSIAKRKRGYDTIVHSHLLEHIYEPLEFLKHLHACLKFEGSLVFSIPNIHKLVETCAPTFLCLEHTYFATEEYIEYLCAKAGFRFKKKNTTKITVYFMNLLSQND